LVFLCILLHTAFRTSFLYQYLEKNEVAFVCFCSLIKSCLFSVFVHPVWALGDKSSLAVIVQKQPVSASVLCSSCLSQSHHFAVPRC
jgi:hypothetical protein